MNPNREEVLFALALEKPAEKRAAFLEVMCEGDSAPQARLEALLAAHEHDLSLLRPAPTRLRIYDSPGPQRCKAHHFHVRLRAHSEES